MCFIRPIMHFRCVSFDQSFISDVFHSTNHSFQMCITQLIMHFRCVSFDQSCISDVFHSTNHAFQMCSIRPIIDFRCVSFDQSFISDLFDDSTCGLLQKFEDEGLLVKRDFLSLEKLIGQGK